MESYRVMNHNEVELHGDDPERCLEK